MKYTPEQRQAISHTHGPLSILASAGSGKTSVLTQKVIRLILEGKARPSQILVLTFTNKAAGEIRERIEKRLFEHRIDFYHDPLPAETFNSFGNSILMEEPEIFGLSQGARLLTDQSRYQLLSTLLKGSVLSHLEITSPDPFISKLSRFIDTCKDNLVTPELLAGYLQREAEGQPVLSNPHYLTWHRERMEGLADLAELYSTYEKLKKEQNLIDYGDQILLPALKLKRDPSFRKRYQESFSYIFVDEYQDTNYGQKEFLLGLVGSENPNVTVVGDDDQAIYGWRGAVVENILNFHQEGLFNQRAHSLALSTNFRCSQAVVRVANKILEPFQTLRPEKVLKTPEEALQGSAILNRYNSDQDEVLGIAKIIREKLQAGYLPSEIAILCRNKKFFDIIAKGLEGEEIPYQIMDSSPLMERWEVKEMVAWLRLLADPSDELALMRLLRSRRIKLGDRDLYYLAQWRRERNRSLTDGLGSAVPDLSTEAHLRLRLLEEEIHKFQVQSYTLPLPELIYVIYEKIFQSELEENTVADYAVAGRNLLAFLETCRRYAEENPQAPLSEFLRYLDFLGADEDGGPEVDQEETGSVKVMTLHKAKGLEFDLVFLPFLAEKVLPTERADNPFNPFFLPEELRGDSRYWPKLSHFFQEEKVTKKSVEDNYRGAYKDRRLLEERRLFYVGITRARKELYFSHSCWMGENESPRGGSRFLEELEDLVTVDHFPLSCTLTNPNRDEKESPNESETEEPRPGADLLALADDWAEEKGLVKEWQQLKDQRGKEVGLIRERAAGLRQSKNEIPDRFSYSSLLTYRECPRRFWYRYLSGLPTFPEREEGSLGKAVHRAIELYGKNGNVLENPEDFFSTFHLSEKDLKAAQDHFQTFVASRYGQEVPNGLESGFSLYIQEVASYLVGRMDRVQLIKSGVEIIDYKTGKPKPVIDKTVLLQMVIYALAGKEIWPEEKYGPIINIMFSLSSNMIESKNFSAKELAAIRSSIIADIRRIQSGEFNPKPEEEKCSRCEYAGYCLKQP